MYVNSELILWPPLCITVAMIDHCAVMAGTNAPKSLIAIAHDQVVYK